jgi:hypothetical protein
VEPETQCTCCGAWHRASWYSGEEGTFCSERCYHAHFGSIDNYIEAARSGRYYFECREYNRILNDPFFRSHDPIKGFDP